MEKGRDKHKYLKRLPPEFYRGQAYVHWSMTVDDRKKGWLIPIFYYKFREILTHTLFRYRISCPIYCCMPDHFHLLWSGVMDSADQRVTIKFFRKQIAPVLNKLGVAWQKQPFDHVLQQDERTEQGFTTVAEYIARNPERAGLVEPDCYRKYQYTGCLIPGFPDLSLWSDDYWQRFWRTYSYLRRTEFFRIDLDEEQFE